MIATLVCIIALTPLFAASFMFNLYGRSKVTIVFFLLMASLTFWQLGAVALYPSKGMSYEMSFFLLRFFRIGQIFVVPLLAYCLRVFFVNEMVNRKGFTAFIKKVVFGRVSIGFLFVLATLMYIVNWTSYDIKYITLVENTYFPYYVLHYDSGEFLYRFLLVLLLVVIISSIIVARGVKLAVFRSLVMSINISFLTIFIVGTILYAHHTQYILDSALVLVVSLFMVASFMKMYNRALTEHSKLLARKSKLEFTGNMTSSLIHEFKNLLTSVKGSADAIASGINSDSLINNIIVGSKHMQNLVDNYQKFIKEGDMNPDMEYTKINDSVVGAIHLIETYMKDLGVRVEFESDKTIYAYVNESTFIQVIINLIKNGAEAVPVEVRNKSVRVILTEINDSFAVDVIDTGSGIERDNWDSVFQEFNTTKENGTGLGLPFCLKTVIAHGGKIYVVNSNPKGTHIRVAIPKYRVDHILSIGG